MKKIILCLIAVVINFITVNFANADFYIQNYDVKMDVNENKEVQITEDIDVYFTYPSHGIYRTIALKPGEKVSNLTSNEKINSFSKTAGVSYSVKLGNPKIRVSGPKHYTIKYKYKMDAKVSNEFYFNVIGTDWPVTIEKVRFSINMPKPFNPDNLGVSIGRYGTRGFNGGAVFKTDGQDILGYTQRKLIPKEGITIKIALPNDYFVEKEKENITTNELYTIAAILLFTLIAFVVWFLFGKDEPVVPVVNFYPPKNKNSAEIGVEYSGSASNKELISLIFYLASKGYLKIEDDDVSFVLTKVKDYDGKNSVEKRLFHALFKNGNTVTKEELEVSRAFYKDCEAIIASLNKIKGFIFDKNACSIEKIIIMILSILGIVVSSLYSLFDYSFEQLITAITGANFIIIFPIMAIIAVLSVFSSKSSTKSSKIFVCVWAAGFGGIPAFMLSSMIDFDNFNIFVFLTAIVGLIISGICFVNLPKRNRKGQIALGNILGFKQFLEVAEKRRIQQLVDENPSYCFDILPFAYVLDVSDKWIRNFEGIAQAQPDWYYGHFNRHSFSRLSGALLASSAPSVANGGISKSSSSGGGGFSGGGSGGGGGGSW